MSPRVITATGPNTLTVAGRLTNSSDREIDELDIRVQRGEALDGEAQLRAALAGDQPADTVTPNFIGLPGALPPGGEREVRLELPVRTGSPNGLDLQERGTYELLVNVNGTPDGSERARLAAARMLLPVLGLPPRAGEVAAPVPPRPIARTPLPVGVLYPLADQPRRLPTGPNESMILTDDELADSLEPTGRLGGLVTALQQGAPLGSPTRAGVCLAVDPALLQTVATMRDGYRVRQADGAVADGKGAAAAGRWLDTLRATAHGGCVLALPYADADLAALSRGGLADLAGYAVQSGAQITASILDTPVIAGTTWPADGILDERGLADYVGTGGHALVLSAESVSLTRANRGVGPEGVVRLAVSGGGEGLATLTDPLLTLAADPAARPPAASQATLAGPAGQDVVGALAFRTASASNAQPLLVAPPHRWASNAEGGAALLGLLRELIDDGRVAPRNVGEVLTAPPPPAAPAGRLLYSSRAGAAEIPAEVITELQVVRDGAADLRAAAENTPGVGRSPADVFNPITDAMLVAASAAWRGQPERSIAAQTAVTSLVANLRDSVRVVEPPGPYTLASEEAPLLLTVTNGLPVAMNVRVELTAASGLRIEPVPVQRVPPLGRIQLRVNAEVSRSGQFPVYAKVLTPSGAELGPPSRLLVSSTAYGTITLWLTAVAGALLIVLAGRRILRRIRRETTRRRTSSPNGLPAPEPTPQSPNGSVQLEPPSPAEQPIADVPPIEDQSEPIGPSEPVETSKDPELTEGPAPPEPEPETTPAATNPAPTNPAPTNQTATEPETTSSAPTEPTASDQSASETAATRP